MYRNKNTTLGQVTLVPRLLLERVATVSFLVMRGRHLAHLPVSAEAMELHHVPPELIHPLSSDVN